MERRYIAIAKGDIKIEQRADGSAGRISGYGAVYYDGNPGTEYEVIPGLLKERIMPGAFDRAIREDDVRSLFNHDPSLILGRSISGTLTLSVDKRGLIYSVDLGDTSIGKDVMEHIRRGDISGASFGFIASPEDQEWFTEEGIDIRVIRSLKLLDVGPVTYPAYADTTANARDNEMFAEVRDAHNSYKEKVKKIAREAFGQAAAARARAIEVEILSRQ